MGIAAALNQYFSNIFTTLFSIFKGMQITFKSMLQKRITIDYPFESTVQTGFRGKLVNYTADCISCNKCVVICPVDCITLEATKREDFDADKHTASTGHPLRLKLETYDIDMNKCMYCNLCTEVCPTECLVMTNDVEYSSADRDDMTIAFTDKSGTGFGRA